MVALGADVGAQTTQLVDIHPARLEDVLGDHRGALGHRVHGQQHRLQVGRQTRVGKGDEVHRPRPVLDRDPEAAGDDLHARPGLGQLVQRDVQVLRHAPPDQDVAARHHRPDRPAARHDPVRDGLVHDRVQTLDADDLQGAGPHAPDRGSHRQQQPAQVDDLGLACRVVDQRRPLGQHGRHQQVLGRADAREVQPDLGPAQPGRPGHDVAVLDLHGCAELDQTGDVHIQRPAADGVAARQRDLGLSAAGDERAEHRDGPADPADQVVVGLVAERRRDLDRHRRRATGDRAPQAADQLRHDRDVQDVGHVGQDRRAFGQQRGGHQLQDAVLGPAHGDLARESRSTGHDEAVHQASLGTQPLPPVLRPAW